MTWFQIHADEVRWALIYLVLANISGNFFQQHGYLHITSKPLNEARNVLGISLSAFIAFRLMRPRAAQDLKALVAQLFAPAAGFVAAIASLVLVPVMLFGRWSKIGRWITLALAAFILFNARLIASIHGCDMGLNELWPEYGKLVKTTDGIYKVYKFHSGYDAKYILFREVAVMPGVALCKRYLNEKSPYSPTKLDIAAFQNDEMKAQEFKPLPYLPPPPIESLQTEHASKLQR